MVVLGRRTRNTEMNEYEDARGEGRMMGDFSAGIGGTKTQNGMCGRAHFPVRLESEMQVLTSSIYASTFG